MLPTLDESGVVVRQTGGRDPHRGIRISDASTGGPQPAGVAPSVPAVAASAPTAVPRPLDKGKGAASGSSAPGGTGGASSPSAPKVVPAPPPAAAVDTAPPGSYAPARGPATAVPTSIGIAAEEVPTAPKATITSTTAMPSSTSSAAAEEVPTAPTPAIDGDAGARLAPSRRPLRRRQRWFLGGGSEAAIRREWEALESEHQRLSDWRTELEERTKAASR
eukprot:XP_020398533.1 predicted GPI-anchored protein 58 [Zea mays]